MKLLTSSEASFISNTLVTHLKIREKIKASHGKNVLSHKLSKKNEKLDVILFKQGGKKRDSSKKSSAER